MIRSFLALFFASCLLLACDETPATPQCTQSSDCAAGETCRDSSCVADVVDSGTGGGGATGGGGGGATGGGGGSTGGGTGGGATGGGGGDVDAGCTPRTCAGLGCGVFSDDCGAMITCTATCECTEQNFESACPSRPCMTLSGCVDFACNYVQATCTQTDGGAQTCSPTPTCSGPGCGQVCTDADGGCDAKLYACGGGICANVTSYCDPSPMVMNGKIVYQNRCVAPPNVGCGTCQLGAQQCDAPSDRFTCTELPIPVADGGIVECDSTVAASTFIYLDPAYTGTSDGSKMRPFTTFSAASTAATARGARGIVIGGNPTFTDTLVVPNGVSIYGGFGVSPLFVPDASKRPLWNIPSTAVASNRLVGATATSVSLATIVSHVEVRTANISVSSANRGASNIGFHALTSPGLKLDDVIIAAGNAGDGVDGVAGAVGATGGNASGRTPGTSTCFGAPQVCTTTPPMYQQAGGTACGLGGVTAQPVYLPNATSNGNNGTSTGTSVPGGARGTTLYDNSDCGLNVNLVTVGGIGGNGTAGAAGTTGAAGTRVVVSAAGLFTAGAGTSGTNGGAGTFGGGGGAGGSFMDGCTNDAQYGGPGGGGGAPGCGGANGQAGGPGGLSIGLLVGNSAGLVVTSSVRITAGNGGRGGRGGAGGAAGPGGFGESVAVVPNTGGNTSWRGKNGGAGGRGGAGGAGGSAGGSAGGDSIGIYCVGGAVPSATSATVTMGTPGAAGPATAPASAGAAGVAAARTGC